MISFWRIFSLELTALSRSRTLWLLLAASVGYVLLLPHIVTGDGTAEGMRELIIRYGLGGVFALLAVCLLASATGAIASERAAKRLQLSLVRPVSAAVIASGKCLAFASVGATVLAAASVIVLLQAGSGGRCNHVHLPVMESVQTLAEREYERYMADTNTPAVIRQARKSDVVRMLSRHIIDSYSTIATNAVQELSFPEVKLQGAAPSVRINFASAFGIRQDVLCDVSFGGYCGTVSNITKTAVTVPLTRAIPRSPDLVLRLENRGRSDVMLRLRRDVELLVPADSFSANVLRAWLELSAALALLSAFGVLLGAGLSRPVALFTAFAVFAAGMLSPAVIDYYPDSVDASASDRAGLMISRAVERATRPVSSLDTLSKLASDDCIEFKDVATAVFLDFIFWPLVFSALAGLLVSRKQED